MAKLNLYQQERSRRKKLVLHNVRSMRNQSDRER